jgi:sugar-specific transcriptional regulator TrmB
MEDLGLSKGEVKVYLTLLELGTTKAGQVIEKSGMASSAVHNSINKLVKKGLASYIKKGKMKFYHAVPPRQFIDFIDDRKRKILDILPELEKRQVMAKERQEAEIFEGINGLIAMLNFMIRGGRKGGEYMFFATDLKEHAKNKKVQDFFGQHDIERMEKGLVLKGLAPEELKPLFVKRKHLNMKYSDFPIPSGISIFKDMTAFFTFGEKPVGFLIKSRQISEMYRELFNRIWERC